MASENTLKIEGYPYSWPIKQMKPGMITGFGLLVVREVGKTGNQFKRGNTGTYYEEWYVELYDPTGRKKDRRYKALTEFDVLSVLLDQESEPVIWKEGSEVSQVQRGSLF